MDQITLEWKTFKIDLISFEEYMRTNYPDYAGNSAHSILYLVFTKKLSDADKTAIVTYYDSLLETTEATKLRLGSRQSYEIKALKQKEILNNMPLKDKLLYTNIEKKLDAGLHLSNADWDMLL